MRRLAILAGVLVFALPIAARAEDLPKEGIPHLMEVGTLGEYAHVVDSKKAGGLSDLGAFDLRTRIYLGRALAYCAGLDGQVGASNEGFAYGATGYLAGLGVRWGAANVLSLCGGAGLDRIGTAVPLAAKFPAELSVAFDIGPVRPTLWLRPSWLAETRRRKGSSEISFIDELEAALIVRLARQHHYWSQTSGGGGFTIGVSYRELLQTRSIGALIGFDFSGGQ